MKKKLASVSASRFLPKKLGHPECCSIIKKERQYYIKSKNESSGFADHCISKDHSLDLNSIKLLYCESKGKKLTYLGNLYIKIAELQNRNMYSE